MGVKQDYLMRMINDVVRGLPLVLTGQREVRYVLRRRNGQRKKSSMPGSWRWQTGARSKAENILLGDFPENTSGYGIW